VRRMCAIGCQLAEVTPVRGDDEKQARERDACDDCSGGAMFELRALRRGEPDPSEQDEQESGFREAQLEVNVTQSSRDEGIDAVAYSNTDIVHRAQILIQASRYGRCAPANDVRALAGSVEEKRVTSGILVTTAWVGPESNAFAARNNRLRIIEGGELKHLLAEYLNLDVRIDLGRRPVRAH
jgi:Restriction endonuclease